MTDVKTKTFCPECGEEFGPEAELETCPNDGVRLQEMAIPGIEEDDPLLGVELDERFVLESILGEGGMGRVYRGRQLSVDREVAVKVLRSDLSKDENVVKRFFREARVISSFAHPNIVNLVDFGQDPQRGVLYLAMEFIDGEGLGGVLERGRLKLPLVLDIGAQVCAALSEPHERGVVHRDLKPENLMVLPLSDGSLQVKVVDFGIAHAIDQTQNLTKTGAVHGTPYYMAPEQARGEEVSAATDLYALGVIMFEMLAGNPPFDGDTSMKIMFQHIEDEPPALTEFIDPEQLPEELHGLVEDLLNKEPEARPGSALAVRERLQAIAKRENLDSVVLDPKHPQQDLYDSWVLPRARSGSRSGQSSPPPGTGDQPMAPDTGDLGEADTVAASQVGDADPSGEEGRSNQPAPTATRETAEQSKRTWLAMGAVGMLLFAGVAAGTALALTNWGGGDEREDAANSSANASGSDEPDGEPTPAAAGANTDSQTGDGPAAGSSDDSGVSGDATTDRGEVDTDAGEADTDRAGGEPDEKQERTGTAPTRGGERPSDEAEGEAAPEDREPEPEPTGDEDDSEEPGRADGSDESETSTAPEAPDDSEETGAEEPGGGDLAAPSVGESGESEESDGAGGADAPDESDEPEPEESESDSSSEGGGGFYPVE